MSERDSVNKWNAFYREGPNTGTVPLWPNESLVRLFKAQYFPWFNSSYKGCRVLDSGFGSGNNLMFCGTLEMELYGVEIHEDICRQTADRLSEMGYQSVLKTGDNRNIPFPDNHFDYLISWDVIHYEREEERVVSALREYARVMKPGARLFLSTVAPRHTILRGSETLGGHQYRIGRKDDFRQGQVFFYFDMPHYLEFYLSQNFSDILIGRSTLDYFIEINDTFLATAVKKK
jgi:ubiquinone/menaquinone biosynthesis C-methylase UbiE